MPYEILFEIVPNEFAVMFKRLQIWHHRTNGKLVTRFNTHQQNYVQIAGYNTVFKNRIGKKGGGVGFYIKESVV